MSDRWHQYVNRLKDQISELKETLGLINGAVEEQRHKLEQLTRQFRNSLEETGGAVQPLHQLPAVLKTILDHPQVGAILVGPGGKYLLFNKVAEELLSTELQGTARDQAKALAEGYGLYLDDKSTFCSENHLPWQKCARGAVTQEVMLFLKKPGITDGIWLRTISIPLRNEKGESNGAVTFLVDTTEQLQVEDQIKRLLSTLEQQLRTIELAHKVLARLAIKLGQSEGEPLTAEEEEEIRTATGGERMVEPKPTLPQIIPQPEVARAPAPPVVSTPPVQSVPKVTSFTDLVKPQAHNNVSASAPSQSMTGGAAGAAAGMKGDAPQSAPAPLPASAAPVAPAAQPGAVKPLAPNTVAPASPSSLPASSASVDARPAGQPSLTANSSADAGLPQAKPPDSSKPSAGNSGVGAGMAGNQASVLGKSEQDKDRISSPEGGPGAGGGPGPKLEAVLQAKLESKIQAASGVGESGEAKRPQLAAVGGRKLSTNKKILIVDDIPVNQKLLRLQLKRLGFEDIETAPNGKDAVACVQQTEYAVVFMDLDMPVMDGPTATAEIRKIEEITRKHVPIIAMTSYDRDVDRERSLKSGMDDYLVKGATQEQIDQAMSKFVQTAPEDAPEWEQKTEADTDTPDAEAFDHLKQLEDFEEISRLFCTSVSTFIDCIQLALDERNADALNHFAHSIKGPASSMGLKQLCVVLLDMIDAAESGDWMHARFDYMKLKTSFQQVLGRLKEIVGPDGPDLLNAGAAG